MSYNVGPLFIDLICTLLSLAVSGHNCFLLLVFGTKLLHCTDISSTPSGTIFAAFVVGQAHALHCSWSACATFLGGHLVWSAILIYL